MNDNYWIHIIKSRGKASFTGDSKTGWVVDGDVDLSGLCLRTIPIQFAEVNGHLDLSCNQLVSLEGLPRECESLDISNNPALTKIDEIRKTEIAIIAWNCFTIEFVCDQIKIKFPNHAFLGTKSEKAQKSLDDFLEVSEALPGDESETFKKMWLKL